MPDPKVPKSPDELQAPAIHGKVSGVSRIGRRAIGLGALVGFLLIAIILYGIQNSGSKPVAVESIPSAPAAAPTDVTQEHFGATEPLALPTVSAAPLEFASPTPAAAVAQAATAVPTETPAAPPAAPPTTAAQAAREQADVARVNAQQARIAREEQAREADAQLLASSEKAPIILAGDANGATPAAASETATPASGSNASAAPNNFLNGPTGQLANGAAQKPIATDRIAPTTPYEIVAGSVIPAILITAINSQNPGLITAQVREDVYDSLSGRNLLVPRGSKLLGVYKNEIMNGQTRVLVAWKRLIFPDTSAIDLVDMSGADVEGSAGFEGRTDTHFTTLLSQAFLASVITAGFQLSQPQQQTASTSGGGSVVVITPGQQAAGAVGQSVTQTVTDQLKTTSMIPPTITIPRGYPFIVVVDRDLVLPSPYRAP